MGTSGEDNKRIRQKNGEIVMDALRNLQEPSTLTNVIKYVADTQQVSASHIKEPVKEVLTKGVEYGFVQKLGSKYTVEAPTPSPSEEEDDEEQVDASRRRRRRKRSKSRKRSRSRRRRR